MVRWGLLRRLVDTLTTPGAMSAQRIRTSLLLLSAFPRLGPARPARPLSVDGAHGYFRSMTYTTRSFDRFVMLAITSLALALPTLSSAKSANIRLAPDDAAIGARLGASVAADKSLVVLGAPDDDEAGPFAGAVYVYVRHGQSWERQAKLLGPKTSGFRSFGESVAESQDTLVVGAPFDGPSGDGSGAAYVYARKGQKWIQQARLTPSDATPNQLFGDAVAIDGSTIVVGSFLDASRAPNAGAVYVFTRKNDAWTQQAKLTASNASQYAFFGSAVAISGNRIVVGAPTTESAYVFAPSHGQWQEQAILVAADANEGDYSAFGASVAIDGNNLVIGAPMDGSRGPLTGAAYTFRQQGSRWVQGEKLLSDDATEADEFGTSVAIDGRQIAVGSPYHDEHNNGAIYLFVEKGNRWKLQSTFTGQPTTAFLGSSVALKDDLLVGGAPAFVEFNGLQSSGAGYIFRAH